MGPDNSPLSVCGEEEQIRCLDEFNYQARQRGRQIEFHCRNISFGCIKEPIPNWDLFQAGPSRSSLPALLSVQFTMNRPIIDARIECTRYINCRSVGPKPRRKEP